MFCVNQNLSKKLFRLDSILIQNLKHLFQSGLTDNRIDLSINFRDIAVTEMTQAESLFGEVGGLLGLFIGASLLTVFEFVDLLVKVTLDMINKSRKRQSNVIPP